MKLLIKSLLALLILSTFGNIRSAQASGELANQQKDRHNNFWAWTNEPWTGDDKPYQKSRKDIDAAIKAGKNPADLADSYKKMWAGDKNNPKTIFRWGYALYLASNVTGADLQLELGQLVSAMIAAPSPHTYEYDRLRFVRDASIAPFDNEKNMGKRLLERDPKDVDVQLALIRIAGTSSDLAERNQALLEIKQAVAKHPNEPRYSATLCMITFVAWIHNKTPPYTHDCLAACQEYLSLTPPKDIFRRQVNDYIRLIKADPTSR